MFLHQNHAFNQFSMLCQETDGSDQSETKYSSETKIGLSKVLKLGLSDQGDCLKVI